MANLVKPPFFQSYEYDPTFWEQFGGQPSLFMPMRCPGRKGGVNDDSGHGNDGTINGGVTWVQTANGMGLNFPNSGSPVVSIPDSASLKPTSGLWISVTHVPVDGAAGLQRAMVQKSYTSSVEPFYQFFLGYCDSNSSAPYCYSFQLTIAGTRQHLSINNSVVFGKLAVVDATYDGATMRLFTNGNQIGSLTVSGAISTYSTPLGIGGVASGISNSPSVGSIHSVTIYGKAPVTSQISTFAANRYGMFRAPPKRLSVFGKPANIYNETGSGGALEGGSAIVNIIYQPTLGGGTLGGGADVDQAIYSPTASGGALGGGDAFVTATYSTTAIGGALGGGTAAANADYNPTASGGAVADGTATFTYNEAGTGGVLANGSASFDEFNNIPASGGALAGGDTAITAIYRPTASGGVEGDGTAGVTQPPVTYDEAMDGGASITGWSTQIFIESHLGWKCRSMAKYIPGMYVKPQRERSRRGALVPGITVCDQGIYYKLLKEGDQLAR